MARYLSHTVAALCAVAVAGFAPFETAAGNELPDPTRPPAALINPSASSNGTIDETTSAPALQSVILRKGRKPVAIIGGERVELGGDYGGARLIKVSEGRVVLSGPSGSETLLLTPAVEKKLVADARKPARKHVVKTANTGKVRRSKVNCK
jgi:MSHA biogenesis protein MshK